MTGREATLVDRLFEAQNPRDFSDWQSRQGYYVATCRVSADDVPGLIDVVRKWNDPNWLADADDSQVVDDCAELLPVTAWRTLGDLQASVATAPLIDMLCELDDEFDDWACEELPHVFGKIGEACVEPLAQVATNQTSADFIRTIAVRAIGLVAYYHPEARVRVVAWLAEMMANAADSQFKLNTSLLTALVDLKAVEAAEPIERAFAGDLLDVGMYGDWETVRKDLGVEGLGLPMPTRPYNSLEQFRTRIGLGIFSKSPLFAADEIDRDAAKKYYDRAFDTFSKSQEAEQAKDRFGDISWFLSLLSFGLDYLGETVDEMTLSSVQEFIFGYVPRKVTTEATQATAIIGELSLFWEYLDRVFKLPAAKSIVEWLQTKGLTADLAAKLNDTSNFGMAKSLMMSGMQAGYDMTSEAGVAQFMAAYNASLQSSRLPQPQEAVKIHVGRNAPCPCGSGKKFKTCCARR